MRITGAEVLYYSQLTEELNFLYIYFGEKSIEVGIRLSEIPGLVETIPSGLLENINVDLDNQRIGWRTDINKEFDFYLYPKAFLSNLLIKEET